MSRASAGALVLAVAAALGPAVRAQEPASPEAPAPPAAPGPDAVRAAIDRGLAFLLKDQNRDGSWGGPRNKTMTDSFANPETHHAWTVGTTGLVVMALARLGEGPDAKVALERGLDYLAANADLRRPADWDNDNVWGQVYGLQGIARALASGRLKDAPRREAWLEAGRRFADGLNRFQSPNGGWGYYADPGSAWRPEWATSFTTAAGVNAIIDAQAAGIPVDRKSYLSAVRSVKHARLPTGAFTYGVDPVPSPGRLEFINQVKGSLGRSQVGNLALFRAGQEPSEEVRRRGVEAFFEHHRFLDCCLRKPIPHESWYANAAYFYLFGHYYAAEVIATLPAADRARFWPQLQPAILKTQEPDGGFWDFYISSHTKPYGTSFSILALALSLEPLQ